MKYIYSLLFCFVYFFSFAADVEISIVNGKLVTKIEKQAATNFQLSLSEDQKYLICTYKDTLSENIVCKINHPEYDSNNNQKREITLRLDSINAMFLGNANGSDSTNIKIGTFNFHHLHIHFKEANKGVLTVDVSQEDQKEVYKIIFLKNPKPELEILTELKDSIRISHVEEEKDNLVYPVKFKVKNGIGKIYDVYLDKEICDKYSLSVNKDSINYKAVGNMASLMKANIYVRDPVKLRRELKKTGEIKMKVTYKADPDSDNVYSAKFSIPVKLSVEPEKKWYEEWYVWSSILGIVSLFFLTLLFIYLRRRMFIARCKIKISKNRKSKGQKKFLEALFSGKQYIEKKKEAYGKEFLRNIASALDLEIEGEITQDTLIEKIKKYQEAKPTEVITSEENPIIYNIRELLEIGTEDDLSCDKLNEALEQKVLKASNTGALLKNIAEALDLEIEGEITQDTLIEKIKKYQEAKSIEVIDPDKNLIINHICELLGLEGLEGLSRAKLNVAWDQTVSRELCRLLGSNIDGINRNATIDSMIKDINSVWKQQEEIDKNKENAAMQAQMEVFSCLFPDSKILSVEDGMQVFQKQLEDCKNRKADLENIKNKIRSTSSPFNYKTFEEIFERWENVTRDILQQVDIDYKISGSLEKDLGYVLEKIRQWKKEKAEFKDSLRVINQELNIDCHGKKPAEIKDLLTRKSDEEKKKLLVGLNILPETSAGDISIKEYQEKISAYQDQIRQKLEDIYRQFSINIVPDTIPELLVRLQEEFKQLQEEADKKLQRSKNSNKKIKEENKIVHAKLIELAEMIPESDAREETPSIELLSKINEYLDKIQQTLTEEHHSLARNFTDSLKGVLNELSGLDIDEDESVARFLRALMSDRDMGLTSFIEGTTEAVLVNALKKKSIGDVSLKKLEDVYHRTLLKSAENPLSWINRLAILYAYVSVPGIRDQFEAKGIDCRRIEQAFIFLKKLLYRYGIVPVLPALFEDRYNKNRYGESTLLSINSFVQDYKQFAPYNEDIVVDLYTMGVEVYGVLSKRPVVCHERVDD